jgi:peptidoglycan-associated lipoprotein
MKVLLRNCFTLSLIVSSLALVSCSSGSKKDAESASDTLVTDNTNATNMELNGSSDDNTAGPLRTIYFDYNSASLTSAGKQALEENAQWLKLTDAVSIQVEGHCDERGGVQFNIALGEKRANRVRDFLTALGVAEDRISTVSYGKDRPNAYGHDDEAWSKNRRANFVITAK